MNAPLAQLIELLSRIIARLENKPDRTNEETLLLVDAKLRRDIARSIARTEEARR